MGEKKKSLIKNGTSEYGFFFFQADDGIRDRCLWLEFRRVLFRSVCFPGLEDMRETHVTVPVFCKMRMCAGVCVCVEI